MHTPFTVTRESVIVKGFMDIAETYEDRRQTFDRARAEHVRRARWISTARLITFFAAIAGLTVGFWGLRLATPLAAAGGGLSLLLFVALVVWHDRVLRARDRLEMLVAINQDSLWRLARRWKQLPRTDPVPPEAGADPVARDLDIFPGDHNRASLSQLLSTVWTPQGRATLTGWLREGSDPEEIVLRQQAVAELSPLIELRQELELRGRQLWERGAPPDPELFLQWAEGDPWLLRRPWLIWITRLLAVVALTLAVLRIFEMAPTGWVVLAIVVNLAIGYGYGRRFHETFNTISGRGQACKHYANLFKLLDSRSFSCTKLEQIGEMLSPRGRTASTHMQRLERLGGLADARFTPLFHLPLVALTLWDFHVLFGFERWQRGVGREVRQWFTALGEIEALCALATLHHDQPDWSFPKTSAAGSVLFKAEGLGHPLLPPEACVVNDVEVGPPGTFLLVTGSNMSGKSTLLRSIGINVVLAQAGGPVFARHMAIPRLILGTSFRVHDSLEAGVSFFMAELRRLKEIVDLAKACNQKAEGPRLLYLLDEILQGTNVYERQIAVRRVIVHVLNEGAIGAVSTHDLTLAEADGLADAGSPCHFTESYEKTESGPHMQFDYKLRPGVSSTVNALKLLEVVGLGEDEEPRISMDPPPSTPPEEEET